MLWMIVASSTLAIVVVSLRGATVKTGLTKSFYVWNVFLGNSIFSSLFLNFQVNNMSWNKSEHRPIELILDGRPLSSGPQLSRHFRPFHFEASWTLHKECRHIIARNTSRFVMGSISLQGCLEVCAKELKPWGQFVNKHLFGRISTLRREFKKKNYMLDLPQFILVPSRF